jgi:hypothetical protein
MSEIEKNLSVLSAKKKLMMILVDKVGEYFKATDSDTA